MSSYFRAIPSVLPANTHTVSTTAQFDTAYSAITSGVDSKIIMNAGSYGSTAVPFHRSIAKAKLQIEAAPGAHVIWTGYLTVSAGADNCWLKDIDITAENLDLGGNHTGINQFGGQNFSVINCFLHDFYADAVAGHNCMLTNINAGGDLVYGTIMTNSRHVLYCANSPLAAKPGIKHFIRCYLGDVKQLTGNAFIIHGYSSNVNNIQNMEWQRCIIANGANTCGADGGSGIMRGLLFDGNIFFNASYRMYQRIQELIFINNRMYNQLTSGTMLDMQQIHGQVEGTHGYVNATQFKDNMIYKESASPHSAVFRTAIYNGAGTLLRGDAGVNFRNAAQEPDVTPNEYYGTYKTTLITDGVHYADVANLTAFSNALDNHNDSLWDNASTLTATSPPDYSEIILNEYDDNRAMLFVWNQDGVGTVTVPMPDDRIAEIYPITSGGWGTPDYSGDITYDIAPDQGNAYIGLIKFTGGTAVQFFTPDAVTTNADGVTDLGGGTTNLHLTVDETAADDLDGVRSVLAPSNDVIVFRLSDGDDPATSSNHFFVTRYAKDVAGGAQIDITSQLRMTYVNEGTPGTAIVTRTFTNVSSTFTTDSHTLSGAEADAITDYDALFVRIVFNQV